MEEQEALKQQLNKIQEECGQLRQKIYNATTYIDIIDKSLDKGNPEQMASRQTLQVIYDYLLG
jgi:hypothetical protein